MAYCIIKPSVNVTKELPRWLSGRESPCQCRRHKRVGFNPWVRKISWRKKWQPAPAFLPGKILWTEESSRLQSRSQRAGHDLVTKQHQLGLLNDCPVATPYHHSLEFLNSNGITAKRTASCRR